MNKFLSTSAAIGSTVLLAALLVANGHYTNAPLPLNQANPGALARADFGRIVAGEFNGDHALDAVVMDGPRPKLVVSAATHENGIAAPLDANDLAVLPGVVAGKDLLVTVGADGLVVHERHTGSGAVPSSWTSTTIRGASSSWSGAKLVRVGDLDGAGGLDVVGIAANGRDVLLELGDGLGGFTSAPGFTPPAQSVYGLELVDWRANGDTSGADEIALLTNLGPAVAETSGALLWYMTWTASPMRMTAVRDGSTGPERLAFVFKIGTVDRLLLRGDAGAEGPYALGTGGVVAIASGDVDGDGDDDLFLGLDTERRVWKLQNLAPSPVTFDVAAALKIAYGPANLDPAANHAGLAVADFDGDGARDVLAPAQGDVAPPYVVHGSLSLVQVGTSDPDLLKPVVTRSVETMGPHELRITLQSPAVLLPAGSGTRMISVKTWRTPDLGQPTIPDAYHTALLPLDGASVDYALPLPAGFSLALSDDLFSFVARQVVVVGGVVVAEGPALTAVCATDSNWGTVRSAADADVEIPTERHDSSTPTSGSGVGSGPPVPSTDPDREPRS